MKHLLLTTTAAAVLLGCSSNPKRVSGEKFQDYLRSGTGNMHVYEYIGEKGSKFYLRYQFMSLISKGKWDEKILYTEVGELDPIVVKLLRNQSKTIGNLKNKKQ